MPRTLVVGFDGALLSLCDRLRAEGRMPTLEAICGDGSSGVLRSTIPYNSAVAWTSLSTGMNPGRHGIFDFVLPRRGGYGYRVATRADRRTPAIWNHATRAGARVAVVNIPMTFPAEPVNGVMVSGMDAPGLDERAVHPAGLLDRLHRDSPDYRIMSKAAHAAGRSDFAAAERELVQVMEARSRFVRSLAEPRDLDLIMVNLEAVDGSHHFFWQHFDPDHPRHDRLASRAFADTIPRVYEATDRELGLLMDAFQPDTVLVVSDHGGGPSSDWVLFMNDWLASERLLVWAPKAGAAIGQRLYLEAKKRLSVPARRALRPLFGSILERAKGAALYGDVDWSRSKAYAHMQPAVRLNLRGREPAGIVTEGQRREVLEEICTRASGMHLPDGRPLFPEARPAEDLYQGDSDDRPDLVFDLAPGTHIRSRNNTGRSGFLHRLAAADGYFPSGVHTRAGMVAASGRGIARAGRVGASDIHQVAASVLAVMGVPAPVLDGEPFSFVEAKPGRAEGLVPDDATPPGDLNTEEEREVLERLRGLGYVD